MPELGACVRGAVGAGTSVGTHRTDRLDDDVELGDVVHDDRLVDDLPQTHHTTRRSARHCKKQNR